MPFAAAFEREPLARAQTDSPSAAYLYSGLCRGRGAMNSEYERRGLFLLLANATSLLKHRREVAL